MNIFISQNPELSAYNPMDIPNKYACMCPSEDKSAKVRFIIVGVPENRT